MRKAKEIATAPIYKKSALSTWRQRKGKRCYPSFWKRLGFLIHWQRVFEKKIVGVEKMTSYNAELNSVKVLCMCNCIIPSPRELNTVGGKG